MVSGTITGTYGEIILLKQKTGSVIGINTKALQGFYGEISEKENRNTIKSNPKQIELYRKPSENLTLF